jgi:predicted ester cyclase
VSAEENKALVRRFVNEVQSAGNIDAIDEFCSPDFINHSAPSGMPSNREGVKHLTAMFRQAFPDSYFTVEDMIAEGDKVVTRKRSMAPTKVSSWASLRPVNPCRSASSTSCASPMGGSWSTGLSETTSACCNSWA